MSEEENDQSGTQRTVAQPRYLQPLLQKMFGAGRSHLPSDQEGLRGARNARSPLPRKGRSDNGVAGTERSMKPLPADFFKVHVPLLINIGGYLRKEGWVNVNSQVLYLNPLDESRLTFSVSSPPLLDEEWERWKSFDTFMTCR